MATAKKTTARQIQRKKEVDAALEARTSHRTLVMAGKEKDEVGTFVGFDGEQRRFAGQKFYWYGEKLPSWVRVKDESGAWVNAVAVVPKERRMAEIRRAHPATPPGAAPQRRLRELEDDDVRAMHDLPPNAPVTDEMNEDLADDAGEAPAPRVSDTEIG